MSRKHQLAWAVWISHQVVPSLVLKIIGIMHQVVEHSRPSTTQIGTLLSLSSQGFFTGVISS
jgi:hypothetical protein